MSEDNLDAAAKAHEAQLGQKWEAQVSGMVALQSHLDNGGHDVQSEQEAVQQWDQNIHQLLALKVRFRCCRSRTLSILYLSHTHTMKPTEPV